MQIAVFVDGCYWHNCPEHGSTPKHNANFWSEKFARNKVRDLKNDSLLSANGWKVVRAWEHEDPECVCERVVQLVVGGSEDGRLPP